MMFPSAREGTIDDLIAYGGESPLTARDAPS
jgi:hypothetical protein